ncbi:MAG: 50S ribosomal protein L3 [Proteobacteria bacterium]|nr:MAG: 50S ribosomal protein L3 [Pseudomonadota bacterium]
MSLGIVGRKIGMTRVFSEAGESTPVTVLDVAPNRVTQVKSDETDGYAAVQVTTGERRPNRVNRAMKGHFAKAKVEAGRGLWEFRVDREAIASLEPGAEVSVSIFEGVESVDVRGIVKGRGFAGVMRRHGFGGGRATHGNSKAHRKPGSIGQNQDPGRVFPGKKMAGHMGAAPATQQNLRIVRIDSERNLLLVRGSIPGPKGQDVIVTPSIKNPRKV